MRPIWLWYFTLGLCLGCFLTCIFVTLFTPKATCVHVQQEMLSKVASTDDSPQQHDQSHASHTQPNVADLLSQRVRVLCWIMTQPHNHESKAFYVNKTWGPRCNKYFFLTTEIPRNQSFPVVLIPGNESRANLWRKTIFAFEHVHDNYLEKYDFFLKADDDSYIVPENLRYLLANISPESPVYAGRHFKPFVKQGYMSGGASYVLSREAVRRFVRAGTRMHLPSCHTKDNGAEDVNMGRCMEAVGVAPLKSLDGADMERFHPFHPSYHMFAMDWPKDFWMWRYTKYPVRYFLECCSNLSISFHYMSHKELLLMHYLIYHLRPFGVAQGCDDYALLKKSEKQASVDSLNTEKKVNRFED